MKTAFVALSLVLFVQGEPVTSLAKLQAKAGEIEVVATEKFLERVKVEDLRIEKPFSIGLSATMKEANKGNSLRITCYDAKGKPIRNLDNEIGTWNVRNLKKDVKTVGVKLPLPSIEVRKVKFWTQG